jgi:hypothetical protein
MQNILSDFIPKAITKDQEKDTGMAVVLLLLLGCLFFGKIIFTKLAVAALLLNMIWPKLFRPAAYIWYGFSHLLGTVVSKLLLSLVFFIIVTPIGLIRKIMGKDSLRLKQFKKETASVFVKRDIVFNNKDIIKPF